MYTMEFTKEEVEILAAVLLSVPITGTLHSLPEQLKLLADLHQKFVEQLKSPPSE